MTKCYHGIKEMCANCDLTTQQYDMNPVSLGGETKMSTDNGPFRVGEPEDEDDSSTVLDAAGQALTSDEIVKWLNYFYGKAHALELDVQAMRRNRDEYRERAFAAEESLSRHIAAVGGGEGK